MSQQRALDSILEDISAMPEGGAMTYAAALFEKAFAVQPTADSASQGFTSPTILAETGFRMQFPQWTCSKNRHNGLTTYTITKPRGNPYAAQHGNH